MDIKAGLYDAAGNAISGSTDLTIRIKRDIDNYFYDFDDSSFKASGWVSISIQLSEPDATNMPGEYEVSMDVSGWNDGLYTAYTQYGGSLAWTDTIEFGVYDGKEPTARLQSLVSDSRIAAQVKGMDTGVINASAMGTDAVNEIRDGIMSAAVDGFIDVEECLKILLAVLSGDITKVDDTYTYEDQAGMPKVTEIVGASAVERTIS